MTLAQLAPGQTGRITRIASTALRQRLEDLGLTPGTPVQMLHTAPLGDPLALRVRGYTLSLRRSDAGQIFLSFESDGPRPSQKPAAAPAPARVIAYPPAAGCGGCTGCAKAGARTAAGGLTLALLGNPNSGKTTLYNALTGAREAVGNYPGVTVAGTSAPLTLPDGGRARLLDLPGIYALTSADAEEQTALAALLEGPDVVINVADASHLERSLFLTLQCRSRGLPMVVALSFTDDLRAQGRQVDCGRLSELLGVPVLPVSAGDRQSLTALLEAARNQAGRVLPAWPDQTAAERYAQAQALADQCLSAPGAGARRDRTGTLDAAAVGRFTALPVLAGFLALSFYLTFGPPGSALGRWAAQAVRALGPLLAVPALPEWLQVLLLQGILPGVGTVAAFLPQLAILFTCLGLLDASGYLARAAYILDRPMARLGLEGRAAVAMLLGFGCTVTAVLAARTLASGQARKRVILLLPFVSCSARLPVYGLLAGRFFPNSAWLVVLGLYALGLAGAVVTALLLKAGRPAPVFTLELPPYRRPGRSLIKQVGTQLRSFLLRAGTLIVLLSTLLWLLEHVTPGLALTQNSAESLLGIIGRSIAPALAPLGLGDWRCAVCLLTGLGAKEAVAASVSQLGAAEALGPASALSFLTFVLLYVPCGAALAAMGRELGSGLRLLGSILWQLCCAWLGAFCVYRLALLLL